VFIVVLLVCALGSAGWYMGFVQALLRLALNNPSTALFVTGLLLLVIASVVRDRRGSHGRVVERIATACCAVSLILLVMYPFRITTWAQEYERGTTHTTTAPQRTFLPRRVLPMDVAEQFARGAQNDSRYSYEALHPTVSTVGAVPGRRLVWQAAAQPNSFVGYWSSGVDHIIEVDADTTRPTVQTYPMHLPRGGEGNFNDFQLVIHRSLDPLSEVGPPVYDLAAGVAIVPLVRWVWGVPRFRGLAVFDTAGTATLVSRSDAAARYPHLRLYSEALVRWEAETWTGWRSGFTGRFLTQAGVFEIAEVGDNPPPTLLDNAEQSTWVVPLEPKGQSYGLAGLLFVDPTSGARTWWNTGGTQVVSPSRALGIAMGDMRISQLKDAHPKEPKLAIRDGQIHWLVPIVPSSNSQVQSLVLVNATSREVVVAPTAAQVFAPVAKDAAGVTNAGSPSVGSAGSGAGVTAQLRAIQQTLRLLQAQVDSLAAAPQRPPAR
jgi:hypothetical protein